MKEITLNEILIKLKSGLPLLKSENEFILKKLDNHNNSEELEQAIRAFGLSHSGISENVLRIEKFLDSKSDIVVSGSVKTLCAESYWGLTKKYLERLKLFLKKEDAFELSETQIIVFSVLGEYLNQTSDPEIYKFIYQMFKEELELLKNDFDPFHKARLERMYHCLDVGIRGRKAEFEYRVDRMKIPDDINGEVMKTVIQLINKKKNS